MMHIDLRTATKSYDYFWRHSVIPEIVIGTKDILEQGEACIWTKGNILNLIVSTGTSRVDDLNRPIRNLILLSSEDEKDKFQIAMIWGHCLQSDDWVDKSDDILNEGIEKLSGGDAATPHKKLSEEEINAFSGKWVSQMSTAKASLSTGWQAIPRSKWDRRQYVVQEVLALIQERRDFLVALVNNRPIGALYKFVKDFGVEDDCSMVLVFSQKITGSQNIPTPSPSSSRQPQDIWHQLITPLWFDCFLLGIAMILLGSLIICCSRITCTSV